MEFLEYIKNKRVFICYNLEQLNFYLCSLMNNNLKIS